MIHAPHTAVATLLRSVTVEPGWIGPAAVTALTWVVWLLAAVMIVVWFWVNLYHIVPFLGLTIRRWLGRPTNDDHGLEPPEGEWPTIDVYLPAYREGDVVHQAVASVLESEYPTDRLSLYVLTEPGDTETHGALERLAAAYDFEEIVVPTDYPGRPNKPRALNYAFAHTDGDVVSVVDAEDIVSPELFRRAAMLLTSGRADYVQGRLDMVNENDGWLNTLFRAEYGYWYYVNLPALWTRQLPIPLGGTTCLFPRAILETISDRRHEEYGSPWREEERAAGRARADPELFPWDPRNVTEDFELGLFLWKEGYRSGYLSGVPTAEESPVELDAWVKQRTRWEKGKMFTFIQYLNYPPAGLRQKVHLYTQAAIPHLGPANALATAVFLSSLLVFGLELHPILVSLMLSTLLFSATTIAFFGYGYWRVSDAPTPTRLRRTAIVLLTTPLYWLLQWIAEFHAIAETYSGQFDWVKTKHLGRNLTGATDATHGDAVDRYTLSRRTRVGALVGVMALATAIRGYNLTDWGFYGEELAAVADAGSAGVASVWTAGGAVQSPLHALILHYWLSAVGGSVLSVRWLSVLLSLVALVLLYLLGTRLFDDRAGLVAAGLFALLPFHVHVGRVGTAYSLVAVLTLASWYLFVSITSRGAPAVVAYVLVTTALAYTTTYAFLVVVAQTVFVLLAADGIGPSNRRWAGIVGAVGVLSVPQLLAVVTTAPETAATEQHVTVLATLLRYAGHAQYYPVVGSQTTRTLAGLVLVAFVLVFLAALVRIAPGGRYEFDHLGGISHAILLLFVPLVGALVVTNGVPSLDDPFVVPASLGLTLLVGRGLTNLPRGAVRGSLVAVIVLSSATTAVAYHQSTSQENWDLVSACLVDVVDDDDAVFFAPAWVAVALGDDADLVAVSRAMDADAAASVPGVVADHESVWLVVHYDADPDDVSAVLSALDGSHAPTVAWVDDAVHVVRYDRVDADDPGEIAASAARSAVPFATRGFDRCAATA